MNQGKAAYILICAAVLEAGGDAVIRAGLHARWAGGRLALYACGAAVLFAYGYTGECPALDFWPLAGAVCGVLFCDCADHLRSGVWSIANPAIAHRGSDDCRRRRGYIGVSIDRKASSNR